jgi:hypothetical protein
MRTSSPSRKVRSASNRVELTNVPLREPTSLTVHTSPTCSNNTWIRDTDGSDDRVRSGIPLPIDNRTLLRQHIVGLAHESQVSSRFTPEMWGRAYPVWTHTRVADSDRRLDLDPAESQRFGRIRSRQPGI